MRLNKFLQAAGVASRRKADELIKAGKVFVNGQVVREPWFNIDPEKDSVVVAGRKVAKLERKVYYIFYKPVGVVSTLEDIHAEKTLMDFIPKDFPRVYPVGRLDKNSEGLMILTNDGDFAYRIMHPKFGVDKTYIVEVEGKILSNREISRLKEGFMLEDGPFLPKRVEKLSGRTLLIVITEGRKREIRRALRKIGRRVKRLRRIAIGPIWLPDDMKPGEIKPLEPALVKEIMESTGKK